MKQRLLRKLAELDTRILIGAMAAIVALAGIECWLLVLRAPLAELRNQTTLHADLAAAGAGGDETAAQIERLTVELPRLEKALDSEKIARTDDGMILFLMDALGRVATRHGVSLGSVRPGARRIVQGFEEAVYDIEARGEYRSLYQWLREAQAGVAPLVVTGFSLRSIDEGTRITLALKLADYRPVTVQGGTP
jgi:Tfp pilus assembly protein PilO